MKIQHRTVLAGLEQERDRLLEALKPVDTKTLEAQLAVVEKAIDLYRPRVTASALAKLPKTLDAAKKLNPKHAGNGNGNGLHPIGRPPKGKLTIKARKRLLQIAVLGAVTDGPTAKADVFAVMKYHTGSTTARGVGSFVAAGWLAANDKKGVYTLTPKGRQHLAQLRGAPEGAPHDPSA